MSLDISKLVWSYKDLRGSEKLVLLAIADYADKSGFCWPSIDTIADKAGLKRRQTQTIVASLEKAGYLKIDRPKTGRTHTSRYTVLQKGANNAPFLEKGCSPVPERVQSSARKGAIATAPESSLTIKNHQQDVLHTNEEPKKDPERLQALAATLRKRLEAS